MKLRFTIILYLIFQNIAFGQLVINEFSAANKSHLTDNYGDTPDWIELYNSSTSDIDISGYYISDNLSDPLKWEVPGGVVPAQGYLVIFASGRDEFFGGFLHAGFKLTQTQEEDILISGTDQAVIDWYHIAEANKVDQSRGRISDGDPTWGVLTSPTPGASNVNVFGGYAPKPTLSADAGFYTGSVSVSVNQNGSGLTSYYTLDGSEPTNSSTLYTGPITISSTSVLRVISYSDDPSILTSFYETNTYFIDVSHAMYVVSIAGDQIETLLNGTQFEPVGTFELFGADGSFIEEAVGDFNEHGNDSWAYNQRGVDYITRDHYGYNNEIHHEIFRTKDRDSYKRLIIKAAANDNYPFSYGGTGAHIRDAYVQSLSQIADLRLDERSHESAIMYVNGEYWGIYELREKVDDLDFTSYYYNQGEGQLDFLKTWGGTWAEYGNTTEWNALLAYITSNDMSIPANYNYVDSLYNTGSLIDYFILNSYVVCADWLNWNTGWWHGKNPDGDKKKWRYILWDMDNTFGHGTNYTGVPNQGSDADPCNPEGLGDPGGQGHVPILNALLENDDFYNDYIVRMADLNNSYLSCDFMVAHLDSLIDIIEPEMQAQIDRWGGNYATWEQNVEDMRDFIEERCAIITAGMVDCYEIEGPYPITVDIEPAGSGTVQFNGIDIQNYPWTGDYFSGLTFNMTATPEVSYVFSHWEVVNGMISPDSSNMEVSYSINEGDSVIAHFILLESHPIVLNVVPPEAGTILLDGITSSSFPAYQNIYAQLPYEVSTSPNDFYFEFDHWELANGDLYPGTVPSSATIEIGDVDTLTAFYNVLDHFVTTIVVVPEIGGFVQLNGNNLPYTPYDHPFLEADTLTLAAYPNEKYAFESYDSDDAIFAQDPTFNLNQAIVSSDDTIYVYFVKDKFAFYVPNSFSPNGDGDNDIWRPVGNAVDLSEYLLEIYSRDGSLIFSTGDYYQGWNGSVNGGDYFVQSGVYIYRMYYKSAVSIEFESVSGTITVVR
jgi:gliding motility-associated-like protein